MTYPLPLWYQVAQLAIPITVGGAFGMAVSRWAPPGTACVVFTAGIFCELAWLLVTAERSRRQFVRSMQQLMDEEMARRTSREDVH